MALLLMLYYSSAGASPPTMHQAAPPHVVSQQLSLSCAALHGRLPCQVAVPARQQLGRAAATWGAAVVAGLAAAGASSRASPGGRLVGEGEEQLALKFRWATQV